MPEIRRATKVCRKCRTEIDKKAKICPQCRSKQGLSYAAWLGIIFLVLAAISGNLDKNEDPKTASVPPAEMTSSSEEEPVENSSLPDIKSLENQKSVLEFEKSVLSLEKQGEPVFETFIEVMSGVGTNYSIFDGYSAANQAAAAAKSVSTAGSRLSIPDNLPKEVKDKLEGVLQDFSTAYFVREKAYTSAMKFFDDQKPSQLEEFKTNMQGSQDFIISSTAKLLEAKLLVGVDLSTQ